MLLLCQLDRWLGDLVCEFRAVLFVDCYRLDDLAYIVIGFTKKKLCFFVLLFIEVAESTNHLPSIEP